MINLLPDESQKQIRAAKINVILARYTFLFIALLVFTVGAFGTGIFISMQSEQNAISEKAAQDALVKSDKYTKIKAAAEKFDANLKAVDKLTANQVAYSDVLIELTNALPSGTAMNSIVVDTATFGKPSQLGARANSYQKVLELKEKLEASPIINNVSIVNVTENVVDEGADAITKAYPFLVNYDVTITKPVASTTEVSR